MSDAPQIRRRYTLVITRGGGKPGVTGEVTRHPIGYVSTRAAGIIAYAELTLRFPGCTVAYIPGGVQAKRGDTVVAVGMIEDDPLTPRTGPGTL